MIQTYKTYLESKTQLTQNVFLFRFRLMEPREITFVAGQYLILLVPQESGEKARRLYSIVSPQTQKDSVDLLVELIPGGVASEYLRGLIIEDSVEFQGPAGMFTLRESERDKIFLATGTGIAPIRSMISSTIHNARSKYYLFWGLRTMSDVYFFPELKQLAGEVENFMFTICLSREQSAKSIREEDRGFFLLGHIQDSVEKQFSIFNFQFSNFDYYLCGGREVVESLREFLNQKQIPPSQVYLEKF